ncbi:MAG: MauE/DoxX family redox-associated membrane protein [Isosphaeraceae bacterium]
MSFVQGSVAGLTNARSPEPGARSPEPGAQRSPVYVWWNGLGIILLAAALLKVHEAVTEGVPRTGFLGSYALLVCAVWFEVFLGCWLLTGLHRQVTRCVVVVSFGLFAIVALVLRFQGSESCGCFGRVRVNPWYTFAFDTAAALAVGRTPSSGSGPRASRNVRGRLLIASAAVVLLGGASTGAILAHRPATLDAGGTGVQVDSLIALKPETWEGGSFPLLPYIELGAATGQLTDGKWLVVLYRHDCSHCKSVVPELWTRATSRPGARAAFIELPPYASRGESLLGASPSPSATVTVGV